MIPFGVNPVGYIAETTVVNPQTEKMIVKSRNITGSSMMVVEETCVYSKDSENPSWTNYQQDAKITAFLPILSNKFENYSLNSFITGSEKGLQAIETLCEKIRSNGVASLLPVPHPNS